MNNAKIFLAISSFIGALVFAFLSLYLPPQGEIDSSVNVFIAQLLLFAATMLGVDLYVEKIKALKNEQKA